jgi:hypothetical protein
MLEKILSIAINVAPIGILSGIGFPIAPVSLISFQLPPLGRDRDESTDEESDTDEITAGAAYTPNPFVSDSPRTSAARNTVRRNRR